MHSHHADLLHLHPLPYPTIPSPLFLYPLYQIDSNGSNKAIDKEKEDEGKEIRFKLQDAHDGFGPMTKDLKVAASPSFFFLCYTLLSSLPLSYSVSSLLLFLYFEFFSYSLSFPVCFFFSFLPPSFLLYSSLLLYPFPNIFFMSPYISLLSCSPHL